MHFAIPADHRVKIKDSRMIDKYLDLARELKELWNMMATVIPIVVGALGTIPKGLEKRLWKLEMRGRIDAIQTPTLFRSVRIPRRVLEIWADRWGSCYHSDFREKPKVSTDIETLKE